MSKMQRFSAMSERHGLHLGKYEKMFSKFGFWMLGLSILSAVLLTISIGFLSWIWFADRDQELWRRLMLGPYNSRSITLTGVAVRYAIACLGWITVAMMASVVVEMYGVPADKIAQASIARYTGSLLPLMFGGFALRKWFKILIPLQMACAIYSQFTSTLLFSDVGVVSIKNFPENRVVNYDFRATKVNNETGALQKDITSMPTNDYVMSGIQLIPTEFQPFAELAQPELASTREEVDDTGPVIRAFLPIGDRSTRDNIESYSGMMRVVDARTICVRPNITEFSIGRPGAPFNFNGNRTLVSDQRDTTNYPFYNGTATIDTSLVPEILDQNRTITIYFECYLLTTKTRTAVEQGTPSDTTPDPNDHYWEQCDTFQEQKQPFPRIVPQNDPLYYNRDRIGELGPETFQDVVEGPNGSAVNTLATGKLAAIRDFRLGSSFLLTDGLEPRRWLFPVNPEGSDLAYGHPLPILDQTSDGPWARIKSRLPANETLNLPGDPIAQRRDVDINFQATFCFDAISLVFPRCNSIITAPETWLVLTNIMPDRNSRSTSTSTSMSPAPRAAPKSQFPSTTKTQSTTTPARSPVSWAPQPPASPTPTAASGPSSPSPGPGRWTTSSAPPRSTSWHRGTTSPSSCTVSATATTPSPFAPTAATRSSTTATPRSTGSPSSSPS